MGNAKFQRLRFKSAKQKFDLVRQCEGFRLLKRHKFTVFTILIYCWGMTKLLGKLEYTRL